MKKAIVLAGGLGLALLTFGAETAPAGAVVGWWKFDDASNPGKDSSDYHNDLDGLSNVTPVSADTCRDGIRPHRRIVVDNLAANDGLMGSGFR